jgi:prepilin peptidase CpaA
MSQAMPLVSQIALMIVVCIAAVYDIRFRRIPNWDVLIGLVLGIGINTLLAAIDPFGHWWEGLLFSSAGLLVALLIYFPLYLLRAMGAGDAKLMAAVGSIVGWKYWLVIFFFTAVLGGVAAILVLLSRQKFMQGLWNVGFLLRELLAFRAPYARNEALDVTNPKSMKLPHGAVIAWGCLFFLGAAWLFGRH